jgi:hypothetical protein
MIRLMGTFVLALFFSTCVEPTGIYNVPIRELEEPLTITMLPVLTEYKIGYPLEIKGIEVVLDDNGWKRDVTEDVTYRWNGIELKDGDTAITAELGSKEITVSYDYAGRTFETSFRIDVLENHFIVTDSNEWTDALDAISRQTMYGSFVITLRPSQGDGFSFPQPANSPSIPGRADGIDVTLRTLPGEKANLRLNLASGIYAPALYITGNQTLIIDGGGLTIIGAINNSFPLIKVEGSGARLELRNGVITGNTNAIGEGGGVSVKGGGSRFIMSGGEISGNNAMYAGGVLVSGDSSGLAYFEMTGGSITGNESTRTDLNYDTDNPIRNGGGGVKVENGNFTMSGTGRISGNRAGIWGAGIYGSQGSIVTIMDGSTIAENLANTAAGGNGGGIAMGNGYGTAVLNLKGGTISGNIGREYGGGLFLYYNSRLQMSGGIIYGLDAPADLANLGYDNTWVKLGAAMRIRDREGGTPAVAEYGYYDQNGGWQAKGPFGTTVNKSGTIEDYTIEVVNGDLK